MISPATWRILTGNKEKEKGNRKMNEPTPNSEAAKTMPASISFPEEPMPTKSVPTEENWRATIGKYMISMARNQEVIFKKIQRMEHKSIRLYHYTNGWDKAIREAISRIIPGDLQLVCWILFITSNTSFIKYQRTFCTGS
ncbi:hypothetical protein V6N12_068463 [Hibiscus sabdariffa]|uniref:Uncharacterized protein n=1 Tax=Hibiscus sabdariffa TaxID=183260 RepID=A0ABR2FQ19_9ROSI